MANVKAQQGELDAALELHRRALEVGDGAGDERGRAAALDQMAYLCTQQGELRRALEMFRESLEISERLGNKRGRAATLAGMAYVANLRGEPEEARRLYREAALSLGRIKVWPDLVTALADLGTTEGEGPIPCLAQALWLCLRVTVPPEDITAIAGLLVDYLGYDHPAAPLAAAGAACRLLGSPPTTPRARNCSRRSANGWLSAPVPEARPSMNWSPASNPRAWATLPPSSPPWSGNWRPSSATPGCSTAASSAPGLKTGAHGWVSTDLATTDAFSSVATSLDKGKVPTLG